MSKTPSPSKNRSTGTADPKKNAKPKAKAKKSAKGATSKSPTCPDTVKADIEACLAEAPTEDPSADSVETWLFTSQNSVAVRVCRILEDKAARKLLTEAAGRTWKLVTDPKGKALRLWARLHSELFPLATSDAKALQCKVDHAPDGVFAGLFSPKVTYQKAALMLWGRTRGPLAVKADLVFPLPIELPIDRLMWDWVRLPHADRFALRYPPAGEPAQAMPMPPIGDFVAALVLNRLGMVVSLTLCLHALANNCADDRAALRTAVNWHHELIAELGVVRREIWDAPDAQARAGAMALLQTYLAVEARQPSFEADWSVIPWPKQPASEALFIGDRPEDGPSDAIDELLRWRHYALDESFKDAMDRNPGAVVRTVKAGLQWLAEFPSTAEPNGTDALVPDIPQHVELELQVGGGNSDPGPKGAKRAVAAQRLKHLLKTHLKAARDHAYSLKHSGKTPKLLARPTQAALWRELQDGGMVISEPTVSRCFDAEKGDEALRVMYKGLLNLDYVMRRKNPEGLMECPECEDEHRFRCELDGCLAVDDKRCKECHNEKIHGEIAPIE